MHPIFILAPHKSYTSIACGMLGQHPELYGLPEMNLFVRPTVAEWWRTFRFGHALGANGVLRVVSELYLGGQREPAVPAAREWVRRRRHWGTASLFHEVAEAVAPLGLVDKSPNTVYRTEYLEQALDAFPDARFLHLLRHPRTYGESIIAKPLGRLWLARQRSWDLDSGGAKLDPQLAWLESNRRIDKFLAQVPESRWFRLRGEDLLTDADQQLTGLARWLGVSAARSAIADMKHPERGPYAHLGPDGARLGNDPSFLERPELQPARSRPASLDGPLPWRADGAGFLPEVRELAVTYGYNGTEDEV
jgi:hypothetical protein